MGKLKIFLLLQFTTFSVTANDCVWDAATIQITKMKNCELCTGAILCSGEKGEFRTLAYCKKKAGSSNCPKANDCLSDNTVSISLEKSKELDPKSFKDESGASNAK